MASTLMIIEIASRSLSTLAMVLVFLFAGKVEVTES
jgi:hypothetical protein